MRDLDEIKRIFDKRVILYEETSDDEFGLDNRSLRIDADMDGTVTGYSGFFARFVFVEGDLIRIEIEED